MLFPLDGLGYSLEVMAAPVLHPLTVFILGASYAPVIDTSGLPVPAAKRSAFISAVLETRCACVVRICVFEYMCLCGGLGKIQSVVVSVCS